MSLSIPSGVCGSTHEPPLIDIEINCDRCIPDSFVFISDEVLPEKKVNL